MTRVPPRRRSFRQGSRRAGSSRWAGPWRAAQSCRRKNCVRCWRSRRTGLGHVAASWPRPITGSRFKSPAATFPPLASWGFGSQTYDDCASTRRRGPPLAVLFVELPIRRRATSIRRPPSSRPPPPTHPRRLRPRHRRPNPPRRILRRSPRRSPRTDPSMAPFGRRASPRANQPPLSRRTCLRRRQAIRIQPTPMAMPTTSVGWASTRLPIPCRLTSFTPAADC